MKINTNHCQLSVLTPKETIKSKWQLRGPHEAKPKAQGLCVEGVLCHSCQAAVGSMVLYLILLVHKSHSFLERKKKRLIELSGEPMNKINPISLKGKQNSCVWVMLICVYVFDCTCCLITVSVFILKLPQLNSLINVYFKYLEEWFILPNGYILF